MENYECICGKKFKSIKSLCSHKASCKENYLQRDDNLDNYYKHKNSVNKHLVDFRKSNKKALIVENKRLEKEKIKEKENKEFLENWISEQHKCERCGKVMTEYFGSGRFCSRACANAHKHSNKTKEKISLSISKNLKEKNKIVKNLKEIEYYKNPNKCIICDNILSFDNRFNKTCCDLCKRKYLSLNSKLHNLGGYKLFSGSNKKNKGYYKGYYCDSTWELAYVIYNLDHGIKFKRCERVYDYEYLNKKHKYHPDFELEDGTLVEIKGYDRENITYYKINSVKDRNIIVLYKDDLKNILNYVVNNYGKNFRELYDKDNLRD